MRFVLPVLCSALFFAHGCKNEPPERSAGGGEAPSSPSAESKPDPAKASEAKATDLPKFIDVPEGPRAPSKSLMGVEVASLTYADAQKLTASLGYTCQNQSVKAAIERMREAKRKEVAEKMKAGDPDAMSGASILMGKSKREKNPQVRWSCEKADPAKLTDRKRETVPGRLLMVFDTPDIPVRHVSYRRSHPEERTAYIDLLGTMKALEAIFGKPTSTKNIPTPNEAGEVAFGDFKAVRVDWKYADLHVKVHAMKMGKRVSINEAMEVPWPVRVTDKQ